MFSPKLPDDHLHRAINRAFRELGDHPVASPEYDAVLDNITKLHKMKAEEKPKSVSPDTVVTAAVHLVGITMILRHEHLNVITSKAMAFIPKLR